MADSTAVAPRSFDWPTDFWVDEFVLFLGTWSECLGKPACENFDGIVEALSVDNAVPTEGAEGVDRADNAVDTVNVDNAVDTVNVDNAVDKVNVDIDAVDTTAG
jgi:hypothetical protein